MLVNDLVDTAASATPTGSPRTSGSGPVDAVRTYVAVDAIFGIGDVWRRIRAASQRTTFRCTSPTG